LIVASEPSGSLQAAALMVELNNLRPGLQWVGVGGPEMVAQGLKPLFPMQELAVMGLMEVLPKLWPLWRRLKDLQNLARQTPLQLVITVDGQDFSKRVAQHLKPFGVPHVHYVAPKVWAWRPYRVKQLSQLYSHLLCNLPFEEPWFKAAGLPTTYVGHPMVEALAKIPKPATQSLQLALLPGSRASELARHWPLMLATYRRLKGLIPPLTGLLTLPDAEALAHCQNLAPWSDQDGLEVVVGSERFCKLSQCKAALAKSGTNNLELALLNIPAVVCYRMHPLTYWLAKWLVKVPSISLPNLILNPPEPLGAGGVPQGQGGGKVYPEFVQDAAKPANLARALYPLLTHAPTAKAQQKNLALVRQAMATPVPAALKAAHVALSYLKEGA
jgi:lipid-A-disaccharide synthase